MMYTALLVAAASLASAQYSYNSTTGVFTCPPNALNGAFCAGESLQTNIIIRCNNGVGQPGNCNDNLSGYFPIGVNYAPCWQTSDTSGDAACSKNCIVEGSSGNYNGTFTLPGCTPTSASSAAASSTTSSASASTTSSASASTTSSGAAATTTVTTSVTTTTSCSTTTSTPSSSFFTSTLSPSGGSTVSSNGTFTTSSISASKTVTGPTTSSSGSTQFTGAANAMGVSSGAGLAGVGLLIAYFL